ncbi:exodeoxyribonuclease VII small subunit [Candidatus Woesearchaeota archaeon]|jgi:exodeoxyribonuclease VII small subunit|nr:exodeoxyribonuclease VII small subunit [Candidatus Woesearchaeota archaeon]
MARKTLPFEDSLMELEALVERMEQGQLPLEEALKTFERGIQLSRLCQKALQEAEQKVQILMDDKTDSTLKPFTDES